MTRYGGENAIQFPVRHLIRSKLRALRMDIESRYSGAYSNIIDADLSLERVFKSANSVFSVIRLLHTIPSLCHSYLLSKLLPLIFCSSRPLTLYYHVLILSSLWVLLMKQSWTGGARMTISPL